MHLDTFIRSGFRKLRTSGGWQEEQEQTMEVIKAEDWVELMGIGDMTEGEIEERREQVERRIERNLEARREASQ